MGFKGIDNKEIKVDVKNTKSSRDAMKRLFDVYLNNLPTEERAEIDRELKSLKETQDKEIAGVVEAFSAEQKKLYQEIVQGFLYNMRSSVETIPVDVMHTRVGEFLTNASSQTNFAVEMKADIVLPLQIALCRWKDGIVKIDGIYGPQFQNALIQYQKEVLKDQTEGVQKRTLQSLNSFLNPERNPNVTVAVNREIEKQEMKNIASDKLQNTGDKLFQEKRIEDAGNYYTTAAVKRANAPQDVDRTKMDEKEKDLDPVSVSTIKKYIRVANNLMDDALRHPNSTAQFKADIYSEASKLLILARNVDPYACNIILRNRKRIDNQPTHTSEESDRIRKTAEENLIRVQNSLHDATYGVRGKVIDEKTKEEKPVQIKPPQPAKVPVWMKQVAYREKELAKARVFNNSFDRVIDDPNTPRGNMTTIQAYLDNYLWPIPRDVPEQVAREKKPNVIYKTMSDEEKARRQRAANPPTRMAEVPTRQQAPEPMRTPAPAEIAIASSEEEDTPRDFMEKNFQAIKFLEKYFVNGQAVMDACWKFPPTGKINRKVQRGDTPLSIAEMTWNSRFIIMTQNDLKDDILTPGQVLDVTPPRDHPAQISAMRWRIMIMKIATPFMKLYDQYGKNDRNPEFIAKSKELAARTTVKLPSGEYRLAFKDQF